jgi:hypothetical protein
MAYPKKKLKLDNYELGIVGDLERLFSYDHETALNILNEYRQVLSKIGGYDNTSDHAKLLDRAWKEDESGELWLKSIQIFEAEQEQRKQIDNRHKRHLIAR